MDRWEHKVKVLSHRRTIDVVRMQGRGDGGRTQHSAPSCLRKLLKAQGRHPTAQERSSQTRACSLGEERGLTDGIA